MLEKNVVPVILIFCGLLGSVSIGVIAAELYNARERRRLRDRRRMNVQGPKETPDCGEFRL